MHFKGAFVKETKISILMMMLAGFAHFPDRFSAPRVLRERPPLTTIRIHPLGMSAELMYMGRPSNVLLSLYLPLLQLFGLPLLYVHATTPVASSKGATIRVVAQPLYLYLADRSKGYGSFQSHRTVFYHLRGSRDA
jgi:hypothetical protein